MQAKDIPEAPILALLVTEHVPGLSHGFYLEGPRCVLRGMPAGTPEKVARAKMAALIRRGLVNGCACGCRGDFVITDAGRAVAASENPAA